MTDKILFIGFLLVCFAIPALIYRWRKNNSLPEDSVEGIDGLADTDIVCVPFKGEWITLTKIEYLSRWLNMNRTQRADVLASQIKSIKQGRAEKVRFDGKYYVRATGKGKEFLNIHKMKHGIYTEGG